MNKPVRMASRPSLKLACTQLNAGLSGARQPYCARPVTATAWRRGLSVLMCILVTCLVSPAQAQAPAPPGATVVLPGPAQPQDTKAQAQPKQPVSATGVLTDPQRAAVQTLVSGLEHPWALAFLPDNQGILITERVGRLRLWQPHQGLSRPLGGLPDLFVRGQGGLLDVALHPDFAQNRLVYLSYSQGEPRQVSEAPAGTVVGVGRLSDDARRLEDFKVLLTQTPKLSGGAHFGSRLAFDQHGYLYITLGENNHRATAQDLNTLQGKIVRLHADGQVPDDNPFVGVPGARPEIWSYGHRNPQGIALNPRTQTIWSHEHGPRGGDELNVIEPGQNYGWPLVTHGINYSGLPIPEAQGKHLPGMRDPHYLWDVSPAISGMAFYESPHLPPGRQWLFIGALKEKSLIHLTLDNGQVVAEARLLQDLDERIRDVRSGPDGALYILTDARAGKVIRLGLLDQGNGDIHQAQHLGGN